MLTNQKSRNNQHFQLYPTAKPYNIYSKEAKALLFFLILSLQITLVDACTTIKSNNSQCQICQSQKSTYCRFTNATDVILLSSQICPTYCCDSNIFNDTSEFSICSNTNEHSFNFATFIIVIVFGATMAICMVVCLKNYISKKCRQSQNQSLGFDAYKLQDLGPLYMDKNQDCAICINNNCNIRTKCGHIYHGQCLKIWIKKQQKCPLCKTVMINPIVLYCTSCFKQSKMVFLMGRMQVKYENLWQQYEEHKCETCTKASQDEIPLDIELSQQINRNQKLKMPMQNIESQENIQDNL